MQNLIYVKILILAETSEKVINYSVIFIVNLFFMQIENA